MMLGLFASVATLYLLLQGLRVALAWRRLHWAARQPASAPICAPMEVDVLVPVLGGDPRLPNVLQEQLALLPNVRWHWLLDADDALGLPLCRALAAGGPVTLHVLAPPLDGVNPKLHKLAAVQSKLTGTVVLVLDDDTLLDAAGLHTLLGALAGHALATGLPRYEQRGGVWSRLLAQFVNDQSAPTYLPLLHFFPAPTLNGMGYALRRSTLEALGGFAGLGHFLTDDLALAEAVRGQGGKIAQTTALLRVQTEVRDAAHWWRQLHRWFLFALLLLPRLPRAQRIAVVLLHGLPPLCFHVAAVAGVAAGAWGGLLWLVMLRAALLMALQGQLWRRVVYRPLASELVEWLQPLQALHALVDRRIRWRTRRYRVRSADRFEPWR